VLRHQGILTTVAQVQIGQALIERVHKEQIVVLERDIIREIVGAGGNLNGLCSLIDIGKGHALGTTDHRPPGVQATKVVPQKNTPFILLAARLSLANQGFGQQRRLKRQDTEGHAAGRTTRTAFAEPGQTSGCQVLHAQINFENKLPIFPADIIVRWRQSQGFGKRSHIAFMRKRLYILALHTLTKGGTAMAKFKRILFPLLMVLCACLLVSCCTPVGRSAEQVEVVDDATITTQIKTSLLANEALNGLTVFVATVGGEVTLTGAVETGAQIKKASEIAYSVRGVKRVTNLIKLK